MKSTANISTLSPQRTSLREVQALVDSYLGEILSARVDDAQVLDKSYSRLWKTLGQVVMSGGKRLRPYLVAFGYEVYAGPEKSLEPVMPVLAAHELLHQAMLIHDDIIDRDYLRHGRLNVAGQYVQYYSDDEVAQSETRHHATGAAILAGDLLISEAYYQLTLCDLSSVSMPRLIEIAHRAVYEVSAGELLDTEASFVKEAASAETIAALKTASYSFEAPLITGAVLADAESGELALLRKLSHKLGVGYQIGDDLLGVFGNSEITGKSINGDIREGKRTVMIDYFFRQASPQQKERFTAIFGNDSAPESMLDEARSLLQESGADQYAISLVDKALGEAIGIIDMLTISGGDKAILIEFAQKVLKRTH